MSRKGENIYKRKDGRWEARYIISRNEKGKARYGYLYARSYAEVKEMQKMQYIAYLIRLRGTGKALWIRNCWKTFLFVGWHIFALK